MLNFSKDQKKLRARIIEITYTAKVAHLGSCLSAVDIIDAVYQVKKKDEKFVLSNGHAAFALYAVLEKNKILKKSNFESLNVHPDRNPKLGIDVSTGSLGQGFPIAVGMALADRSKRVYCVISDGECNEGSIWESLRIAIDQKLGNLIVVINANGWGAYDGIDSEQLVKRIQGFGFDLNFVDGHKPEQILNALNADPREKPVIIFAKTFVEQLPFLRGQDALYFVMGQDEYKLALKIFNE